MRQQRSGAPSSTMAVDPSVQHRALLDRLMRSRVARRAPEPIGVVGMLTRDQPSILERGLRSYIENVLAHRRRPEFVVVDDSTERSARQANLRCLRTLRDRYKVEIDYAGPREKSIFVKHLGRAGLPRDVVEFMLASSPDGRSSAGANRNALFLHAVGQPLLSADDDTICAPVSAPAFRSGLRITSSDPTQTWFPDRPDDDPPMPGPSVLAIHEQVLGTSLGECVRRHARTEITLDSATPRLLAALEAGGGSIQATRMGLAGDLGSPHLPSALIQQTGCTHDRLVESEPVYRRIMTSHLAVRSAPIVTIGTAHSWMTTIAAYDHRGLLPPFLPLGRGQDTLFGAVLDACAANDYIAYLPYTIVHRPRLPRVRTLRARHLRVHLFHVVLFCIEALAGTALPSDPAGALRFMGRGICDLVSSMTPAELESFIRTRGHQRSTEQIEFCEDLLRRHAFRPDYWARDLQAYVALRRAAMTAQRFALPLDVAPAGSSRLEVLARTRRAADLYGQLLSAWPDVVDASLLLKARGTRLARPV